MVMLLMQHGADPNIKDGEGCSGLHLAAQFGHTAIVAYLGLFHFQADHLCGTVRLILKMRKIKDL